MMGLGLGGIVLLAILTFGIIVIVWAISTYNGLVTSKNEVENAWSQIDVQLKRRHDLIPNLIETVKGYAKHESGTLENVTKARNMAVAATGVAEKAQAENVLSGALKSLFAVSEAYPDLKANQNFMALQEELTSTENKISFARQFYNDRVMSFNTRIQQFPTNIIAGFFSFATREFFEAKEPGDREVPKVAF